MKRKQQINLNAILIREFNVEKVDQVKKKLKKNMLDVFLMDAISLINEHLSKRKYELSKLGMLQVAGLSSAVLIRVNETLRKLINRNKKEKEELEYYLGHIMKRIIKLIIDNVPRHLRQFQLQSIQYALEDCCKLYKYNFNELSQFIQINELVREVYVEFSNLNSDSDAILLSKAKNSPGFKFCHGFDKSKVLPRLLILIEDLRISEDCEKISKLFEKPTQTLAIRFNDHSSTYIMQFWVALSLEKIIESDQKTIGYYQVLESHVVNFKEEYLKNKDGQRGADRVRKLIDWDDRREEFRQHFRKLI